nr:RNA-directed DNA polymerase, eukaryota [Tanacetum cinerariifolium]
HGEDYWNTRRASCFSMNFLSLNVQGLGFKAKKDWIRELISKHKVSFLYIQETKMESVLAMEEQHIISDNFVALYGTWIPNKQKLVLILVYAPQSVSSKRMLWSYIASLITSWNGESLVMGDFNEVRCIEERWGSVFNVHGSNAFNSFISNSGLNDIQLEGYSFRWAHPSATKMILKQLHDVQSSNNCDLMQKAKIRWAIEGDENSKYFHAIINKKCANLSVKGVMVDGDWINDPDLVKQEFRSHFADRFQDPGSRGGSLNFLFSNRLSNDQIIDLESPVSKDEIHTAVTAVEWFFEHEDFAIGCNSSFVALIPKVLDPKVVSDYRPISLIGSLYKVVTKIVATQLSLVISDLISDVQTAFLPNRQILDGVGIPDNCVAEAAKSISCSIMKTPFKYLGILVGDNMSSIKAWDEAISKMKKRLSRNFFNGIQDSDRNIVLVKWSKVLASKKYEGLGVSSFYALNRALLLKWVWRYLSHDNSLWSRVISAILGLNGQVLSAAFNSTWSSIINEVNSLKDKEEKNHISVADKMRTAIFFSFRRPVRGGVESQQHDHLSILLDSVILSNMKDKWFWDLNGDSVFLVKDVRILLDEAFLFKMEVPTRWIKSIPIKVNVFA